MVIISIVINSAKVVTRSNVDGRLQLLDTGRYESTPWLSIGHVWHGWHGPDTYDIVCKGPGACACKVAGAQTVVMQ